MQINNESKREGILNSYAANCISIDVIRDVLGDIYTHPRLNYFRIKKHETGGHDVTKTHS